MDSTLLIPLIVTICVLIIGTVLMLTKNKPGQIGSRGNTVLLSGEMSSGKTTLYYYLKTAAMVDSVTSIQPNTATFALKGFTTPLPPTKAQASVYDLPGHGTFKSLLPKILPTTRTLFFLVDSNATSFSGAAQSLYAYLTNQHLATAQVPIVIVCTKTDQPGAMPLAMVRTKLQQEIEVIRKANANTTQLDAIGTEKNDLGTIPLTQDNKPFAFDETDVEWTDISVKTKSNLDSLIKYL